MVARAVDSSVTRAQVEVMAPRLSGRIRLCSCYTTGGGSDLRPLRRCGARRRRLVINAAKCSPQWQNAAYVS